MIKGLLVTTGISFFIIRSASMRDLSSNVANYNKEIIMRLKSLINVVTLVIAKKQKMPIIH
jgi:hypothetical protein